MKDAPRSGTLWGDVAIVPARRPGWCETCRTRRSRPITNVELLPGVRAGYCSDLCALFDVALASHLAATTAADGDRLVPLVVLTRTQLRLVADVYDEERIFAIDWAGSGPHRAYLRAEWHADALAGLVLPIDYDGSIDQLRADLRLVDRPG